MNLIDSQIEQIAEAEGISIAEASKQFVENSDNATNLDDLKSQKHSWTDRGLKWTCENAGHPWHEAFKHRKNSL